MPIREYASLAVAAAGAIPLTVRGIGVAERRVELASTGFVGERDGAGSRAVPAGAIAAGETPGTRLAEALAGPALQRHEHAPCRACHPCVAVNGARLRRRALRAKGVGAGARARQTGL